MRRAVPPFWGLFVLLSLVVLAAFSVTGAAQSEEPADNLASAGQKTVCTGPVAFAVVTTDLTVPEGATCSLEATEVLGHVKVKESATFTADLSLLSKSLSCREATCTLTASELLGTLVAEPGSRVATDLTAVQGEVECAHCASIRLHDSSIASHVTASFAAEGGAFCRNTIEGDLRFRNGSGSFDTCEGNSIAGKLEVFRSSGAISVVGNVVGENLRLERNDASSISLLGNTAGGSIFCVANSPTPTAAGNTATSISAACGQS